MARAVRLYDHLGRTIPARRSQGWDAGGTGRRARHWEASRSSINSLISGEVPLIRDRTRDVHRKNGWASAGLASFVANAVGKGIRPRPRTENDELRAHILEAFEEWTEQSDADGNEDFYGQQATICRAQREGGEAFVRFRDRRPDDGLAVPLQLQVLEAELCDASRNEEFGNGRRIRSGVEFNVLGQRVAYHMYREHPGEFVSLRSAEVVPVPASQVAHVFEVMRPGQIRGIPALATVLARIYTLDKYDDAVVERQMLGNMFSGYLRTKGDLDIFGENSESGAPIEEDEDGTPLAGLEPGTVYKLPDGYEMQFTDPPDVGAAYEQFMRMQLLYFAAGAGVTYEQLTGDLRSVNFSSIRTGLLEMRRRLEQFQQRVLIFQFCRKVWRRWVETAILSGRIQVPRSALAGVMRAAWLPPGWDWVDPEKDVRATVREIRAGLTTRAREVAKRQIDVEELDRELAAERARERELELVLDSNPSSDGDGSARASALTEPAAGGQGEEGGAASAA